MARTFRERKEKESNERMEEGREGELILQKVGEKEREERSLFSVLKKEEEMSSRGI